MTSVQGPFNFVHAEGLQQVPLFDVIKAVQANTALHPFATSRASSFTRLSDAMS